MKAFRIIITAFLVMTFVVSLFMNGFLDLILNNARMIDTKAEKESPAAEKTVKVNTVTEKTNAESINKKDEEKLKKEQEKKKAEEKKKEEESKAAEEQRKKELEEKQRREWQSEHDKIIFTSDHMVDDSWFDDALFVGDSVTNALAAYSEDYGRFGNADFLCIASLGYNSALWDLDDPYNVHPMWKGKKVTVDEGVRLSGKHKIFIMFGMNDVGKGIDQSIEAMKELTDRILRKSPGVEIYIQGGTPMLPEVESESLSNELMRQFNQGIKEVCDERGFHFIDITPAVCDQNGALIPDYCMDPQDMGMHLNYDGCQRWVDYLMAHVLDSADVSPGVYTPQPDYNSDEEDYTFYDDTVPEEEEESSESYEESSESDGEDTYTEESTEEYSEDTGEYYY